MFCFNFFPQFLCERLNRVYQQSLRLINEEAGSRGGGEEEGMVMGGGESVAVKLGLKKSPDILAEQHYPTYLTMAKNFMEGMYLCMYTMQEMECESQSAKFRGWGRIQGFVLWVLGWFRVHFSVEVQASTPPFAGNIDANTYEDTCREMFGVHAYVVFTIDRLMQNLVRQV